MTLSRLPLRNGDNLGGHSSVIERRTDPGADSIGQRAQRVDVAANIPAGHRQRLVTEYVADKEGIGAGRAGVGADRVTQIMDAHALEPGGGTNAAPVFRLLGPPGVWRAIWPPAVQHWHKPQWAGATLRASGRAARPPRW